MARPTRYAWLGLTVTILGLAAAGCAGTARSSARASSTAGAAEPAASAAALEHALSQALKRQTWSDLRLDTECRTEDGLRAATVFGSGVGVWNRERQLALPREKVLSLLRELAAAGFPRMPETYGEAGEEAELICMVGLDLDGATKQVHQVATGPQSPVLTRLAHHILETAEEAGHASPQAASLTEGLGMIARGELAPELLTVHVLRQSEAPGSAAGWQLALEGGKAILQPTPAPDGQGARTAHLAVAEIAELAGQLAAARLEELPANLWAPEYTDFEVRVLNHRRSLQARQFAGMTPETHGEAQQRFDHLWEELEALNRKLSSGN